MGTPRASASVDQMRNVQRTASRGGAWLGVRNASRGKATEVVGISCDRTDKAGAIIAVGAGVAILAEVDCVGFCCGKIHDFILAQHAGQSAFCAADMLSAHARTAVCGARVSARASKMAIIARRNIKRLLAGVKAFVQCARFITARR